MNTGSDWLKGTLSRWDVSLLANDLYYRREDENLQMLPSTIHALLHVADCLEWNGSAWVYWAFPMERMNGMLLNLIKSKVHMSESLANGIVLQENLHHLRFHRPNLSTPNVFIPHPRRFLDLPDGTGQFCGPTASHELSRRPLSIRVGKEPSQLCEHHERAEPSKMWREPSRARGWLGSARSWLGSRLVEIL